MTIEQLLNKLIEKGWRPFNKDIKEFFTLNEFTCGYRWEWTNHLGTIRDIVSPESWLWQFVCKNWMINYVWDFVYRRLRDGKSFWLDKPITHYTFRLIESSLRDESELEGFLLQNIKIWD